MSVKSIFSKHKADKEKDSSPSPVEKLIRRIDLLKESNDSYADYVKHEAEAKEKSEKQFNKSLAWMIQWASETYDIPVEDLLEEVKEMLTAIELNDKYDM